MLRLGQKTKWGKVAAISTRDGERYYFLVAKSGTVALMPAATVEPETLVGKGEVK